MDSYYTLVYNVLYRQNLHIYNCRENREYMYKVLYTNDKFKFF